MATLVRQGWPRGHGLHNMYHGFEDIVMCKLEMVWDLGIKGAFCCCDSVFGWFGIPGRERFLYLHFFFWGGTDYCAVADCVQGLGNWT